MTTHARRSSSRRKAKLHAPAKPAVSDVAVYIGLLMIGAFAIMLAGLLLHDVVHWTHVFVGYLIAMVVLVNMYGWQAYLGKHLQGWQQALARLPLRIAGYGTKRGKPLPAAKGQADARMTLMLFGAGSVLIVAVVSVLLIR